MSKHKRIDAICVGITLFTLLLTILLMSGKMSGILAAAGGESAGSLFTENDLNAEWDTEDATKITLSDEGSTVTGNGAYISNGDVYIVYAGNYVLSGELSDGSVIVEADSADKIWLMFSEVSVHCEDNAALRVEQAGKVFLTLREGTENILSSGSAFSEEAVSAGVDGTIYSKDDLTINGAGSLNVTAEYRHGIVCNDNLVITGGTVEVTAKQDAVHVNDSALIREADLTLFAGDDGITVSNDEETSFLYVESGNIRIPSCREGLEAVRITIAGGTLDIQPADDGLNACGYSGNSAITITGGEITVIVENGRDADGLDSNKNIYISGGKLFVSVSDDGGSCAIDYGSEYGGVCEISGGIVLACGSGAMAEGFDPSSPQGFLMRTASAAAGTIVTVKDMEGEELISEEVPCSFSSVLVSTPEMKVGDTCTLIVGDTATEMIIDNAAASGGFGGGGFGGGFGGGNGQDVKPVSGIALADIQSGNALSGFPGNGEAGGMRPSEEPNGLEGGVTPPDMPNGGGWNFGGRQDGDNERDLNWNAQGREDASRIEDAGTPIPAETLLLLCASAVVLVTGCVVAARYRRRG